MRNQLELSNCENPDDVEVYFYTEENDERQLMFLIDAEIWGDHTRKEGFFIDMVWAPEGAPMELVNNYQISVGKGRHDP